MTAWQAGRFRIDLSRPRVMGIVNITPDSFSDGGAHATTALAIAQCERLVAEGADLLDLGGESTRPGAAAVGLDEERARVLPVLQHALRLGVPVSVDTRRRALMQQALHAGADIINDVNALRDDGAEALLAVHPTAGVCLMHMRGEPATMQQAPHYDDVVEEVAQFLAGRAASLQACGMAAERIVLDPGFGFGKTDAHQVALHRALPRLQALGFPVLVGWSRKSTLGRITGRPVHERLPASLAAALAAVQQGARLLRVHDVAATVDALKVWQALQGDPAGPPSSFARQSPA
ncbi:MAG: dihydropteroate synthase [Burkholderiales bacterium]|nr:dihydropteroate synthase [Burkholderiales bacterium]